MLNEPLLAMTSLTDEDLEIILKTASQLSFWADASQADVFIDVLMPGGEAAIVAAEAHPATGKSLYNRSVKGEIALKDNEPGVFRCLTTGKPVMGSRGISQEGVPIQQNVIPIHNRHHETVAALIMERDITDMVEQEKHVEVLMETAEQLGETLFHQAMAGNNIPALIHEGLLIFDDRGLITFANAHAQSMAKQIGYQMPLMGTNVSLFFTGRFAIEKLEKHGGILSEDFQSGNFYVQIKAVCIHKSEYTVGGIMLLRDLTEMKEKEREIMIKSAVIKEIHHRVKNNLQTIASLLRLQMRRSQSREVEKVFRESINRIMSISIIHEVLSQDGLDEVDCKEIFEYMTKGIVSSMRVHQREVQVQVGGDSLYLNSRNASSLALVINELVQNAMNHAFTEGNDGNITIWIQKDSDLVTLSVADNGVGFHFDPMAGGNLGLEICRTLVCEDLNGTIEFTSKKKGTTVMIQFPVLEGERDTGEL